MISINSLYCILCIFFVSLTLDGRCWTMGWSISNLLMSGTQANMAYAESVAVGMQLALDQCQQQFKWDRWNCPETSYSSIFKQKIPANREMAFLQAIVNAGIVHTLTRNCTNGQFDKCACSADNVHHQKKNGATNGSGDRDRERPRNGNMAKNDFRWSGCSDSVQFAAGITRNFLETVYKRRTAGTSDLVTMMSLHNGHVGREAVKNTMVHMCKCHGVSGSCQTKTCWTKIADFPTVARYLRNAYNRAVEIDSPHDGSDGGLEGGNRVARNSAAGNSARNSAAGNSAVRRGGISKRNSGNVDDDDEDGADDHDGHDRDGPSELFSYWDSNGLLNSAASAHPTSDRDEDRSEKIKSLWPSSQLVFLEASPDYCHANASLGIAGTLGRTCSRAHRVTIPDGPKDTRKDFPLEERRSCKELCRSCGHRVKKRRERVITRCKCKFSWCCQVQCESCAVQRISHVCS